MAKKLRGSIETPLDLVGLKKNKDKALNLSNIS